MYTIHQAAMRTGLRIPTIRAWERRYGVVDPVRTPAGYRLYDDASITRLIAMRHLVEQEGWRPSQAAERVLAAGDDLTELIPNAARPSADPGIGSEAGRLEAAAVEATAVEAFVTAARAFDVTAMDRLLDLAFAAQRFEGAMDDVVFPALRAIGEAWSAGEIDVAAEHAASETVRRRLAHFFDAAGRGAQVPQVIVGSPPDGRHEIGAFAFAVAARRAGIRVLYLGTDVPVESWLRAVKDTGAGIAVLPVLTEDDASATADVVDRLRAAVPGMVCAVGGAAARRLPISTGVIVMADHLDDAVATVADLVARPGSPATPGR